MNHRRISFAGLPISGCETFIPFIPVGLDRIPCGESFAGRFRTDHGKAAFEVDLNLVVFRFGFELPPLYFQSQTAALAKTQAVPDRLGNYEASGLAKGNGNAHGIINAILLRGLQEGSGDRRFPSTPRPRWPGVPPSARRGRRWRHGQLRAFPFRRGFVRSY